jgi:hypothetical protein
VHAVCVAGGLWTGCGWGVGDDHHAHHVEDVGVHHCACMMGCMYEQETPLFTKKYRHLAPYICVCLLVDVNLSTS